MTLDVEAWDEGFEAGLRGRAGVCPYPPACRQAWSWQSGYIEGKATRMSRIESGARVPESR